MSLPLLHAGSGAAGPPPSSLLTGLSSFWAMDTTGWLDAVGGRTLTPHNGVTLETGKVGNAAGFASASEQFLSRAADAGLEPAGSFTLAAWFRKSSGESVRVGRWDQFTSDNRSFLLRLDGITRFFISGDGTNLTMSQAFDDTNLPDADTWYAVRGWYDADLQTANVQLDGHTIVSQPHTFGTFAGTSEFLVGCETGQSFSGGMADEVGYWTRVLTDAEWAWYRNSGAGRAYPWAGGP